MVAGSEPGGGAVAGQERADREPVREPFRERDEIGLDAELLEGEEAARPAEPGLHLVHAEQRADLACDLCCRTREVGLQRDHAALAEHRLEQHESDIATRRDRTLEGLYVVRRREHRARHERAEALPFRGLTGHGERAQRPAVEATLESDDPGAFRLPCARA